MARKGKNNNNNSNRNFQDYMDRRNDRPQEEREDEKPFINHAFDKMDRQSLLEELIEASNRK